MLDIFAKRRDNLRDLMISQGFDALLVRYPANRYYLSGFELHDVQANESAGSLIIGAHGQDFLATDPRYEEAAQEVWPKDQLVIYRGEVVKTLCSILRKVGTRIGVEIEVLSQNFYEGMKTLGRGLSFEPCDGLVEKLRVIKDEQEMAALEKSFALNHAMLSWLEGELQPGQTEVELSWKIEKYFREHGASELAFTSIVAIDEHAAKPHALPSSTPLKDNCLLLVDVGCRVDNYCSDQTRTFWVGSNPSDKFKTTLELVQKAQQTAISALRPGVTFKEAYAKAYQVFEACGVQDFFTHGLGHGVGLETHEKPSLSPREEGCLQKGMVVTVEPGLYYPEWGGIRWEHTVVIEEDGARIL
ncbi:MAG: aminopeptidase P family protein [Desulfovibrionaceae bacterium]|nr:aminopeptidase P family protein [Desulfovibrionaceae bacterium]